MTRRLLLGVTGSTVAAAALAIVLSAFVAGHGGMETPPAGGPASSTAESDGTSEGIKVHGHWVIEVREPDGSLVERREFENALLPSGAGMLPRLLWGDFTVGNWRLTMTPSVGGNTPCVGDGGVEALCLIGESTDPSDPVPPSLFTTLTVNVPWEGPDAHKLVLSGSFVAQKDGEIGAVSASVLPCVSTTAPAQCVGGPSTAPIHVTKATITPIPIAGGLPVVVKVVISFS